MGIGKILTMKITIDHKIHTIESSICILDFCILRRTYIKEVKDPKIKKVLNIMLIFKITYFLNRWINNIEVIIVSMYLNEFIVLR